MARNKIVIPSETYKSIRASLRRALKEIDSADDSIIQDDFLQSKLELESGIATCESACRELNDFISNIGRDAAQQNKKWRYSFISQDGKTTVSTMTYVSREDAERAGKAMSPNAIAYNDND